MSVSLKSKKENGFMFVIMIVFAFLLLLSFTSKLWLFDDDPIQQTPFNEDITALNQTTLTLLRWKYNKEDEFMEVVITKKHTGTDVILPSFHYKVEEYEKGEIDYEIVMENEELVVLKLEGFTDKFKQILVKVEEIRDEETLIVEQKELDPEVDVDEITLPEPQSFTFVGDYRKIEMDNKLLIKNEKDYQKERLELEVANLKKEIAFIKNDKIPLEKKLALELDSKINALKEDMEFQTTEEKEESLLDIASYENDIVNVLENIKVFEEQIEKIEERIDSYHKRIEKLSASGGGKQEGEKNEKQADDTVKDG